jgi:hypothetical protein
VFFSVQLHHEPSRHDFAGHDYLLLVRFVFAVDGVAAAAADGTDGHARNYESQTTTIVVADVVANIKLVMIRCFTSEQQIFYFIEWNGRMELYMQNVPCLIPRNSNVIKIRRYLRYKDT